MEEKKRAILVEIVSREETQDEVFRDLDELSRLINTYGGIAVVKVIQKRGRPSAKTYVGTGKAFEIQKLVSELNANLVVVNGVLKPNQVMNLNRMFGVDVWDRVDLILKIFEKHASTKEAQLQVEIACLKHEFPKLYGRGVEMSQLAGHIGIRGPGEKRLEYQKRHLRAQIKELERKLEKIKEVRTSQRKRRQRMGIPLIALVGYTNSGKSTLLKALTKKEVYIKDELFATLDTKIGDTYLDNPNEKILVADTIGFIKNLPPFLINSFLATLEEVKEADLILHVIDSPDSEMEKKVKIVESILEKLGCADKPRINVYNKSDLVTRSIKKQQPHATISALKKSGLIDLKQKIKQMVAGVGIEPTTSGL